jgi:hypothetical protein
MSTHLTRSELKIFNAERGGRNAGPPEYIARFRVIPPRFCLTGRIRVIEALDG